ncbi:MAG: protoporphyrinogen oxidase [Syntrophobacterales bacterium CG03_land_8_20_14_0_80_58_14]|nr:MAG: protoporphyrinogen oxidase [Syntrophaceae bacterium CG2_30_58_14]PIV04187.1 MAG: protoporphyrinogen oxidase [Syntrophobacterales bacterium CG03_land_8_20_14_0_80_58_14]
MNDKKIAIVGGGISALACAVDLKEKGFNFTLFEKENSVGGKLFTERIGEFTVEGGPDSYLPEKIWSVQLIKKVGLEGEMLCSNDEHKGTFIYSGGRLHPLPEGVMLMVPTMIMPLVKSRLISWPGKIRMGMELFVPSRKDLKDESLAEFVTRRLGRECLEKIAEPLVAGIHTSNPDNMSVLATFPRFVEMERKSGSLIKSMVAAMKKMPPQNPLGAKMTYFMSMKGGMQELVQGCVSYVGAERIRTGTAVVSVEKKESGYRLTFGNGSTTDFDAVVLATPAYVTKEIIGDMDEDLCGRLSAIAWSSSATVSIAFRKEDIKKPLPGFGFIVPRVENRRINACTWSSIKWAKRAPDDTMLVRSFVGGGHHEELVSFGDKELLAAVREELREMIGISAEPVFFKVYRWFQGMPKYTVGHLERIAAIDEKREEHRGLFLIGCSYRGIGIGDCVKSGFDAAAAIAAL